MSLIKCRYCGEEISAHGDIWVSSDGLSYFPYCTDMKFWSESLRSQYHEPLPETEYVTRILNNYL